VHTGGKLGAGKTGHHDVGEEQVDGVRLAVEVRPRRTEAGTVIGGVAVKGSFRCPSSFLTLSRRILRKPELGLRQNGGAMLDELLVEVEGKRYLGHVGLSPWPALARRQPHYWQFAHRGRVIAEFPATTADTPASVKDRFLSVLARVEALNARGRH
jgi:hypothetical protein